MTILCIGDSMTYGMGVPRAQTWVRLAGEKAGCNTVNRGVCGDTSGGMLVRLAAELREKKPRAVMIMGGVNDFIAGGSPEQAATNCMGMGAQVTALGITPIFASPVTCDAANIAPNWGKPEDFIAIDALLPGYRDRIKRIAGIFGAPFLDLTTAFDRAAGDRKSALYLDGLHLNPEGHALLADIVAGEWKNQNITG